MELDLEILSRNMKLLRIMHGMSQETLAAEINISRTTYTSYERCSKTPSLQALDSLAALYNIGFDTLVFCDLSRGLLYRIYLTDEGNNLDKLLADYENLTVSSRNLIMERMETLLEREKVFYSEYAKLPRKRKGKK